MNQFAATLIAQGYGTRVGDVEPPDYAMGKSGGFHSVGEDAVFQQHELLLYLIETRLCGFVHIYFTLTFFFLRPKSPGNITAAVIKPTVPTTT